MVKEMVTLRGGPLDGQRREVGVDQTEYGVAKPAPLLVQHCRSRKEIKFPRRPRIGRYVRSAPVEFTWKGWSGYL